LLSALVCPIKPWKLWLLQARLDGAAESLSQVAGSSLSKS
jgi:hypothetical protein